MAEDELVRIAPEASLQEMAELLVTANVGALAVVQDQRVRVAAEAAGPSVEDTLLRHPDRL